MSTTKQRDITVPKKGNAANRLSDEVAGTVGRRMRFLRESRGLSLHDVNAVSASSLTNYECHDPSTLKLGDLCAIASSYGMDATEFFSYLMSGDILNEPDILRQRMLTYFARLDQHTQQMAVDIVHTMSRRHQENTSEE